MGFGVIRRVPARSRPEIVSYYEETWFDYRVLWMTIGNPAIHFGYWDEGTRSHRQSLDNMSRVMADVAQVSAGDRVLDAGCGVGGGAFWLAQNRGARVQGITIVGNQASRGLRFARSRGLENRVSFSCQDYCRTAFAAESFDVVWARESVCHAEDKGLLFEEAHRLLRPGGRLVIAEYARTDRPLAAEAEELLRTWLRPWAIPDLATSGELTRFARDAGFDEVVVRDVTASVEPSLRRLHRIVSVLSPGAMVLHRLGLRSRVQHGNVTGSAAMWAALRRGLWRYVILSARKPSD
jgi:cyclopropane fatty-acyl-phospholipid synthase-like methyltransferase